ncbi:hypothetical protein GE061_003457 [Apolygus lucorum]|uniref:Uncharacterized protein n=1 Tax=Apolygus lucorum TaxID=248454 RepID=A0A6A4JMV6_APOLU|nr:hypothetical protein GE061_003457 [Apolygus lucorum]
MEKLTKTEMNSLKSLKQVVPGNFKKALSELNILRGKKKQIVQFISAVYSLDEKEVSKALALDTKRLSYNKRSVQKRKTRAKQPIKNSETIKKRRTLLKKHRTATRKTKTISDKRRKDKKIFERISSICEEYNEPKGRGANESPSKEVKKVFRRKRTQMKKRSCRKREPMKKNPFKKKDDRKNLQRSRKSYGRTTKSKRPKRRNDDSMQDHGTKKVPKVASRGPINRKKFVPSSDGESSAAKSEGESSAAKSDGESSSGKSDGKSSGTETDEETDTKNTASENEERRKPESVRMKQLHIL